MVKLKFKQSRKPIRIRFFQPVKLYNKQNISRVPLKNLTWPQASIRFPKLNPFGDIDRDGKLNMFDCRPFDKRRHGKFTQNIPFKDAKTYQLYHGTSEKKAKEITKEGMIVEKVEDYGDKKRIYLTALKHNAAHWAERKARDDNELGGGRVLAIRLTREQLDKYRKPYREDFMGLSSISPKPKLDPQQPEFHYGENISKDKIKVIPRISPKELLKYAPNNYYPDIPEDSELPRYLRKFEKEAKEVRELKNIQKSKGVKDYYKKLKINSQEMLMAATSKPEILSSYDTVNNKIMLRQKHSFKNTLEYNNYIDQLKEKKENIARSIEHGNNKWLEEHQDEVYLNSVIKPEILQSLDINDNQIPDTAEEVNIEPTESSPDNWKDED